MKISVVYFIYRLVSKFYIFLFKLGKKLCPLISNLRNYLQNTKFGGDL